jgi:hypothetical protein
MSPENFREAALSRFHPWGSSLAIVPRRATPPSIGNGRDKSVANWSCGFSVLAILVIPAILAISQTWVSEE